MGMNWRRHLSASTCLFNWKGSQSWQSIPEVQIIANNVNKMLKSLLRVTNLTTVLCFVVLKSLLNDSIFLSLFTFGNGTILIGSKLLFVSPLHCYCKLISQRYLKKCSFPRYSIYPTICLWAKIIRYLSRSAILLFPTTLKKTNHKKHTTHQMLKCKDWVQKWNVLKIQ